MQHPMSSAQCLTVFYAGVDADDERSRRHQPSSARALPATFTESVRAEIRSRLAASGGAPGAGFLAPPPALHAAG